MFWKLQENVLENADIEKLVDFIRTTERFTQFVKVKEFEDAWSKWQGCKYSVYVNSGSSANLLALNVLKRVKKWKDGNEVIVPTVTWVTNISPVFQTGFVPVFVDVNLEDFSFNYEKLASKITPQTRAIFVTHLLGFPADLEKIKSIIGDRDIEIIEDCCEAHGAKIRNKKVGNFGICSTFSFYWGHHITSVEGGMLCTNNEEIYKMAVLSRSHGLVRELPSKYHEMLREKYSDIDFNFLFLTEGFNFRNTELHAVLGLSQLKKLDGYIKKRNENYQIFKEILYPYKNHISVLYKNGISSFSLPFLFKDVKKCKDFREKLNQIGVESRPIVSGNLLRQPFLEKFISDEKFPNAEYIHSHGFYIGNNQFVGKERLSRLSSILEKFFSH